MNEEHDDDDGEAGPGTLEESRTKNLRMVVQHSHFGEYFFHVERFLRSLVIDLRAAVLRRLALELHELFHLAIV